MSGIALLRDYTVQCYKLLKISNTCRVPYTYANIPSLVLPDLIYYQTNFQLFCLSPVAVEFQLTTSLKKLNQYRHLVIIVGKITSFRKETLESHANEKIVVGVVAKRFRQGLLKNYPFKLKTFFMNFRVNCVIYHILACC